MTAQHCVNNARHLNRVAITLRRIANSDTPRCTAKEVLDLCEAANFYINKRNDWMERARRERKESLVRFGSDGQRVQYRDADEASEHFLRMQEGLC
jgi:hypothetical protein